MSAVIKLNNRFEYCQKRIRELGDKCNGKKKHKKDYVIYSSTDEEYGIQKFHNTSFKNIKVLYIYRTKRQ